MNIRESITIRSPSDKDELCAKFTIDDTATPFVFHGTTRADTEYTLSFYVCSDAAGTLSAGGIDISTNTEWTRHIITFTADSVDMAWLFTAAGTYYIYHPQLEIGNKATDFVLCPDDYSTTAQMNAAIELAKDSIELSVSSTYATINDVNGMEERVSSTEARITVMSDEISSKVSKDGIISSINQSAEDVTIDAAKINLTGYVTMANLATDGETVINGANIKTGIIDADLIDVDALFAKDITATGTIRGVELIGARGTFTGSLFSYYGEIGGWQMTSNCLYSEIEPIAESDRKLTAVFQNLMPGLINFEELTGTNCTYVVDGNNVYVTPTSDGEVVLKAGIPVPSAGAYRLSIDSGYKRDGDGEDVTYFQYPVAVQSYEDESGETIYTEGWIYAVALTRVEASATEVYRYDFNIAEADYRKDNAEIEYTMSSAKAGKTYKFAFRLLKDGVEIESTSPAYGVPADALLAIKDEVSGATSLPFYLLRDGTFYTEGSIYEGGTMLADKYASKSVAERKEVAVIAASQTNYTLSTLKVANRNGNIDVDIITTVSTVPSGWLTIGTIPAGYRPYLNIYQDVPYFNAALSYANLRLRILPGGDIQLAGGTAGASYTIHIQYLAA